MGRWIQIHSLVAPSAIHKYPFLNVLGMHVSVLVHNMHVHFHFLPAFEYYDSANKRRHFKTHFWDLGNDFDLPPVSQSQSQSLPVPFFPTHFKMFYLWVILNVNISCMPIKIDLLNSNTIYC